MLPHMSFFFLFLQRQIAGLGRTWRLGKNVVVFGSAHPKETFGSSGPLVGSSSLDRSRQVAQPVVWQAV